jgi:flagella basal body P-ring formation protein FlgA
MIRLSLVVILLSGPALGDSLVATRLIRPTEILRDDHVVQQPRDIPGAATQPGQVVGLEARVAIYPGRPVLMSDLGPAAVIERNDTVLMIFRKGGLTILSEGRALGRAALGDSLTVMNIASRQSVTGRVTNFGEVEVGQPGLAR